MLLNISTIYPVKSSNPGSNAEIVNFSSKPCPKKSLFFPLFTLFCLFYGVEVWDLLRLLSY